MQIAKYLRPLPEDIRTMAEDDTLELIEEERGIIAAWSRTISGFYAVVDHTAFCSIFVSMDGENVYLVHGLRRPLKNRIYADPPIKIETSLMPFKGKIITDGFINNYENELTLAQKTRFMKVDSKAMEKRTIQTMI